MEENVEIVLVVIDVGRDVDSSSVVSQFMEVNGRSALVFCRGEINIRV